MRMVKQSTIQAPMAKKKDTNKKYQHGNYYRTCGNCGLFLRESDEISFVPALSSVKGRYAAVGSNYFHSTPEGCANASDRPMIIPQAYKERLYLLDDLQ